MNCFNYSTNNKTLKLLHIKINDYKIHIKFFKQIFHLKNSKTNMSTNNLNVVPNTAVSSVGSAWITCRSKSYAGRIYYFNTATGETVWNLSEPEMQRAKAMTKIFKRQSGFHPDDCPEPVHSPEEDVSQGSSQPLKRTELKHHMAPAKIYNKQVINNQFTKPYSGQLPYYNMSNGIQLNIPVTPTFNGLWNLSPQPIFVAPTPVHQLQQFPNFNQVPVTSTTVSLSNRFKNVPNKGAQNTVKFKGCKRNLNFKPKINSNGTKKYFNRKLQNKRNNVDLRHIISSRKSSFNNNDFIQPSGSTALGNMRNANNSYKNTLRENNYTLNDDDMWLEENLQSQGKTDRLDATPLKSYFQIDNSHLWYIIADSDALLNNVNFLNILLNSDKQCRLIVPQIVKNIIEKATNSRLRTSAHRAAYFISQQLEANLASIVSHDDDDEGSTDEKHCIITCCSNLMKQDFYVIILTDSMELNVLKETGEMPILTISEIKKLLTTSQSNEMESIDAKVTDSRNIKITIPNTNKLLTYQTDEVKTDQVEVQANSPLIVSKNVTSSIPSSSSNTDLNTNCITKSSNQSLSHDVLRTEKKRKNSKDYSTMSSSESGDKVGDNSTSSNTIKDVSIEELTRCDQSSKLVTKEMQVSKLENQHLMECDNVMFEVTGQVMEDYLKMKSDEWVSRFIQIMEEVLAQMLQQEPKFVLEALPPPWTIYEATECIKRKFIFDSDIVDAATKLLNVLFELGGLRGNIKNDLTPEKYMEMYSFGVYLIDTLQGLLSNSEDLQTAAESLSKLLSDIQNPHLDPCNQDSFADLHLDREIQPQDDENCYQNEINTGSVASLSEKLDEPLTNIGSRKIENTPSTPKRDENSTPDSPKVYNLRSNRKKKIQDKEDVIFIRHLDIESSFFSSLELKKNADKGIFGRILPNNTQTEEEDSVKDHEQIIPEKNAKDDVGNKKEPTFIRNITKCIEFENKLKENSENSELPYDSWTHRSENYEEELDYESMEEGYYMDGEYNYNEDMYETDEDPDEILKYDDESQEDLPNDNNNIDFKFIVQKLQSNIKRTYSEVHDFCKTSYEKLSSTEINLDECDILLAEKTYLFIENLCNSFNRILERETSDSEYKLQEVFKNKEFEGVIITGENLEDYRSFINNCLGQGNVLKESVRLIIDASKEVA